MWAYVEAHTAMLRAVVDNLEAKSTELVNSLRAIATLRNPEEV